MTDLSRFDVLDRRRVELEPAPRLGRLFAWIVDVVVVTVAAVFVARALAPGSTDDLFDTAGAWGSQIGVDPAALFAPPPPLDRFVLVWLVVSLAYHSLCTWALGVSVGKLVMAMSVVDLDRQRRVGPLQAVGRQLLWVVDAWGVAPVCIVGRRDRRRVGEMATNTMTVSGIFWNRPLGTEGPDEPVRAGFHIPGALPGTSHLPSAGEVVVPPPLDVPVLQTGPERVLPPIAQLPPMPQPPRPDKAVPPTPPTPPPPHGTAG